MKLVRMSLETKYLVDMATNNGFVIKNEDKYAPVNVDALINNSKYMDSEYRCECGAFIGQDLIGQICPRCRTEITLHSLNFKYTGWIDIAPHKIISPIYYNIIKRVIGNYMLKFILGDYKTDYAVKYNENDKEFEKEKANKKAGRLSQNDINFIKKKVPKSKYYLEGLGHDKFYERFEEIITACGKKDDPEVKLLLDEKHAVFTSKIPVYSTAFRPVSKTSETMFYPKINKWFAMMCSIALQLPDMPLECQQINALNVIQNNLIEATDHIIKNEMSKKSGFLRSEIVGGTFSFSARAVITLDTSLRPDEVDLPYSMIIIEHQYIIAHRLAVRYNMTLEQAYLFVQTDCTDPLVVAIVDELINEGIYGLLLREPVDNLGSILRYRVRKYKINSDTISLSNVTLTGLCGDFDGDALNTFFIPSYLVPEFDAFHLSCMYDYVHDKINVDWLSWCSISAGLMSL